jgi:cation:H+ antiporter
MPDTLHYPAGLISSSILGASVAFPVAAALALGASFLLVSRIDRLAARKQLSETMLGLIVALAADAPEITSAITASSHGQTGIGAGVVLGSNVFNLAALLGLGAIVAGRINLHRRVVVLDGVVAMWVAAVAVVVVSTGLGAAVGLVLVLAVVSPYLLLSAWRPAGEEHELAEALHHPGRSRFDLLVGIASLAVVVAASTVMERSAETLGRRFDLSSLVVGGIILAAVTSLPNAVGAVYLASRGRGAAVLSEAVNSNMLNVLAGLLLPGVFIGLGRPTGSGELVGAWYGGLTVLSLILAFAGRGLSRRQGLAIVAGYIAFLVAATTTT